MNALLRRAAMFPFVFLILTVAIFLGIHALPGDPARLIAGPRATQSVIHALHLKMGLDEPLAQQYWRFLTDALTGNFGISLQDGRPVTTVIAERLPYTLALGGIAYSLALIAGVGAGILAAARPGSIFDWVFSAAALLCASLASFWVALLAMEVFSVRLGWLPLLGAGSWPHYVMPVCVLALTPFALILRMTKTSMSDILRQDYISMAYAKGLGTMPVLLRHALRNALVPVVTVAAMNFGTLIGGAVVTETVFDWPGVGRLLVDSVRYRDYPVIQGIALLSVCGVLGANLVAGLIIQRLDPRQRC